jgi:putative FmdB family regulatory protein
MPIYEFKCLKCNEFFEMLVMHKNDTVEMRCTKCGSEDFERILSASHSVVGSSAADQGVKTESRSCSGGSCTTLEIPGPSR